MEAQREITLDEWVDGLPEDHSARYQLKVLHHCRSHPFKWAKWDMLRKLLPFREWKSPINHEEAEKGD